MGRIGFIPTVRSFKRAGTWLALFLCTSVLGCREKPNQVAEEYNVAGFFVSRMGSYENRFPNAPITNLQEVLERGGTPYPAKWHHKLHSFGKHAGFKNSLFEKYVFVPTRFSNDVVRGDITLLNAEPFPDREGKYGRVIFSKWRPGWDGWMFKWYPEEQVQEFFRAAGQKIPEATPMPPLVALPAEYKPSYPLPTRIRVFFEDLASAYGPGRAFWLPAMLLCGVIVLVVVIFLFMWVGRRGRH